MLVEYCTHHPEQPRSQPEQVDQYMHVPIPEHDVHQEHMTEGASNGGNHISCKFAEHDLIWKTAKWVLIELRASFIALTVHFQ